MRAIVSAPSIADGDLLLRDLEGAFVRDTAAWILDVKVMTSDTPGASIPDGPFPVRAFVSDKGSYRGEIIVWITAGHVSGLEFAWVSDAPPTDGRSQQKWISRCSDCRTVDHRMTHPPACYVYWRRR